jgi:hypothetical protein
VIPTTTLETRLGPIRDAALAVGVVAGALCAVGGLMDPAQFFRSYLMGVSFWVLVALGCLALMMIHNVTGGLWGHVTRRIHESGSRTFPLLCVLFVPVLLGAAHVYEWTDKAVVAKEALLQKKAGYLNLPFFTLRTVIYFLIWGGLGLALTGWSREAEETGNADAQGMAEAVSAPGLALLTATATFAGIDWLMSLEPRWVSAAYGLIFGVGGILSAHAFTLVFLPHLMRMPGAVPLSLTQLNDLGNLLLAFVMFWTYVTFSQFLIIYCGNTQEEVIYYMVRIRGGWDLIAKLIALVHFVIPFFLLLSPSNKRDLTTLSRIALLVLAARVVDMFFLVAPVHRHHLTFHWLDAACGIAVGGVWMWLLLKNVVERPLNMTPPEGAAHG